MNPSAAWNNAFDRYKYSRDENAYVYMSSGLEPESKTTILARVKDDEVSKQNQELSSPITTTPQQYEKYKQLTHDYVQVLSNPVLAQKLKENLASLIVAEPETNVATLHSKVCPYGEGCQQKGCFLIHPDKPEPEAMNGPVKIDHYPVDLNTQNAYKIFFSGQIGNHHSMCCYTQLGFVTNDHAMYYDKHTKKDPIPIGALEIEIKGVRYTIDSFVKFPEINGGTGKPLPSIFQDMVVCKIKTKLDIKPAKGRSPRDGEKVLIVSANQLTEDGYINLPSSTRTQEVILNLQSDGMFHFQSNNQPGDSGSPVYSLERKGTLVGIYFGQAKTGVNTLIPIDDRYLPNINNGALFAQTKNSQPTV
jgi:hypothetical protein